MVENKEYTVLLQKGLGLIPETISLLKEWNSGMNNHTLTKNAIQKNLLGKSTAQRVKDLIGRIFFKRYFVNNEEPARFLKQLIKKEYYKNDLIQILYIYSARADLTIYDFICDVYWPKFYADVDGLSKNDSLLFIKEAKMKGYLKTNWSDPIINRVASGLLGYLHEFKLLGPIKSGKRAILPYHIIKNTVLYLVHELHFQGFNNRSILEHSDWSLFGLKPYDVLSELRSVSYDRHFILQYSGDILNIEWKYKNMEECNKCNL